MAKSSDCSSPSPQASTVTTHFGCDDRIFRSKAAPRSRGYRFIVGDNGLRMKNATGLGIKRSSRMVAVMVSAARIFEIGPGSQPVSLFAQKPVNGVCGCDGPNRVRMYSLALSGGSFTVPGPARRSPPRARLDPLPFEEHGFRAALAAHHDAAAGEALKNLFNMCAAIATPRN